MRRSNAGDNAGAAEAFGRAARLAPGVSQIHFNLGLALQRLGRHDAACDVFRHALDLQPGYHKARLGLAESCDARGDPAQALPHFEQVVRDDPRNPANFNNLGVVLSKLGRTAEAAQAFQAAVRLDPKAPRAHQNLGNMVRALEGDEAAEPHYRRAVDLDPAYASAWMGLAIAIRRKDEAEAAECYRRALALSPGSLIALSGLVSIDGRACDFEGAEATEAQLAAALAGGAYQGSPWVVLANVVYRSLFAPLPDDVLGRLTDRIAEGLAREVSIRGPLPAPPACEGAGLRPLRLGYLSPNFGDHPVGQVTASLFACHDRGRFEVHGFSTRDVSEDDSEYAHRHRAGFDRYHDLAGLSSREAASRIRSLDIDILVDLDGYMANTSPPILAFRPAPVQVFWLGHSGGLGLPFVDYLIADEVVVPPGEERRYREAVVRLPEVFHCADRHPVAADCPPRSAWGLPEEGVVYCAFNNPEKIDRVVFDCWMGVLRAVEGSVLWVTAFRQRRDVLLANLRRQAEAQGVDPSRVILAERVPDKALHLARMAYSDLMLDTLTLNASTTALDGLWAGVPLLAVRGDRFSNRISNSMLRAVGLQDLVCADLAEYERRAVELGRDPQARAALRERLRANLGRYPLFDTERFARHLERAYEQMWERHCRGEPAVGFDVPAAVAGSPGGGR